MITSLEWCEACCLCERYGSGKGVVVSKVRGELLRERNKHRSLLYEE